MLLFIFSSAFKITASTYFSEVALLTSTLKLKIFSLNFNSDSCFIFKAKELLPIPDGDNKAYTLVFVFNRITSLYNLIIFFISLSCPTKSTGRAGLVSNQSSPIAIGIILSYSLVNLEVFSTTEFCNCHS